MANRRTPRSRAKQVNVTTIAELHSAFNAATGGERIVLAPGDYVPTQRFQSKTFNPPITIINYGARGDVLLAGSYFQAVSGVRLINLEMYAGFTNLALLDFDSVCSDVQVVNCTVRGPLTEINGPEDVPHRGIYFSPNAGLCSNVKVLGCTFYHLLICIEVNSVDTFEISDNLHRDNWNDGLQIHGSSKNGIVRNNTFGRQLADNGDHGDHIQLLFPGTMSNILIENNWLSEEDLSPQEIQCMLGGHENSSAGDIYENITISNNIMVGRSYHGIDFQNSTTPQEGIIIEDNIIVPRWPYYSIPKTQIVPQETGKNNIITGNIGADIQINTGVTATNNIKITHTGGGEITDIDDYFINGRSNMLPQNFLPVPGAPNDFGNGIGAEDFLLKRVGLVAAYMTAVQQLMSRTIDFECLPYPNGPALPTSPVYDLDFGDGTTHGTTASASHTYAAPGVYDTVMTITGSGGAVVTVPKTVLVRNYLHVDMNFDDQADPATNAGAATGTITGMPVYAARPGGGYALDLTSGAYALVVPMTNDWRYTGRDTLVISLDFKTSAVTQALVAIHTGWAVSSAASGAISFTMSEKPTLNSGGGFSDNAWHHLLISIDFNAQTAKMYIDGTLKDSDTYTGTMPLASNRGLSIGVTPFGGYWLGQLDNLVIFEGVADPSTEAAVLTALRP